jgi:hypothetical protein
MFCYPVIKKINKKYKKVKNKKTTVSTFQSLDYINTTLDVLAMNI